MFDFDMSGETDRLEWMQKTKEVKKENENLTKTFNVTFILQWASIACTSTCEAFVATFYRCVIFYIWFFLRFGFIKFATNVCAHAYVVIHRQTMQRFACECEYVGVTNNIAKMWSDTCGRAKANRVAEKENEIDKTQRDNRKCMYSKCTMFLRLERNGRKTSRIERNLAFSVWCVHTTYQHNICIAPIPALRSNRSISFVLRSSDGIECDLDISVFSVYFYGILFVTFGLTGSIWFFPFFFLLSILFYYIRWM